ncbi:MAG: hypothetical protein ABGY96_07930 [bacterium]|nr:hypothetical protein [Gammaproteobacteria bacterium]HIL95865.1 hypothetical protein [Pseudomonadales bacterium]
MRLQVYGQTHSPWVQAVLLGLYEKRIEHTLTTATPLKVLKKWGVMMPAARVDDDDWQLESAEILQRIGFGTIDPADMKAIYTAWQGVMHRADSATRFFHRFSLAGDPHPFILRRLWRNFWRSFSTFYFFILIRFRVMTVGYRDPEDFAVQFLYWNEKLATSDGPFLGGDQPNTTDLILFGIIQCHCSIPVPPLTALTDDERLTRLREWMGSMNVRFSNYPYLYSGAYFEPWNITFAPATLLDQAAFWEGAIIMVCLFPVTVPLVFYLMSKVPR